ncbi:hypothetical protein FRC12_016314 [Ceratobasidium sp. 428]|nr:hypothetical protein FRC12_016314 [Ceratobasidium sp. 428]
MMHDPEVYPDPHIFRPSRFMPPNSAPDPRKYVFGFGRRVCPGIHVAHDSTFIHCAGLLAVFDIQASKELLASVEALGGRDSPNLWELFHSSKIVRPKPYKCIIRVRDGMSKMLLENSIAE